MGLNKKKLGVCLIMMDVYLLAVTSVLNVLASNYFDLITDKLQQSSYRLKTVGDAEDVDSTYYKTDFSRTGAFLTSQQEYIDEVQRESVVLLQNNGLPLSSNETKITLFGKNSHQKSFASGTGSSGYASDPKGRAIDEAFKNAGFNVNSQMYSFYAKSKAQEYAISEIPADVLNSVTEYNDVGVVFIGRGGGEGNDIMMNQMSLTTSEISLIDYSLQNCKKTIVILNTGNQVDCGYFHDKNISVILIGTTGAAGIGCVPKILKGEVNPSGHLVDTYAFDTNTAPASYSVGNIPWESGTVKYNGGSYSTSYLNYVENIYVGYRYYETRYADVVEKRPNVGSFEYEEQVQFPFGYGLSYTNFEYSNFKLTEKSNSIICSVDVKNIGGMEGKDAVELYMQSPYTQYDIDNKIEKSAIQLVGFAKTQSLKSGDTQTITIEVSKEEMKAYDEYGAKTYIVDEGDYYFSIGNDAHDALNNVLAAKGHTISDGMTDKGNKELTGRIHVNSLDKHTYAVSSETGNAITNHLDEASLDYYLDEVTYLSRNNWVGTFPTKRNEIITPTEQMIIDSKPVFDSKEYTMPTTGANNGLSLISFMGMDYNKLEWEKLLDQATPSEMMNLFANAGFHTLRVDSVGKPAQVDNDGTNALQANFFDGTRPLVFPGEPTLAATWNIELIAKEGYYIAQACLLAGLTGWYAPGANIHRLPVNGRNVDYFSEDPFMAGKLTAAVTKEASEHGVVCYVKHFALNEQEANRTAVATFATEQAIREIYLRPFEESMTDGKALGMMTAMNYVGMKYCSANPNLLTNIVRDEWGFKGTILTDATSSPSIGKMNPRDILLSGTDLILCSGNTAGFHIENYESDPQVMTALRNVLHHACYATLNSNAMNGITANTVFVSVLPPWAITLICVDCVIGIGSIVGVTFIALKLFKPKKKEAE